MSNPSQAWIQSLLPLGIMTGGVVVGGVLIRTILNFTRPNVYSQLCIIYIIL